MARDPAARVAKDDDPLNGVTWIKGDATQASFTPPGRRTAGMREVLSLSDLPIDEIEQSDVILIEAPMYNYGMPAALKAWFDQVARIGRTFSFDLARGDYPIEPVLSGKMLLILSSRGEFGFEAGGLRAHLNCLDPAIATRCAHYLGVADGAILTVTVEYQEFKDHRHDESRRLSFDAADALACTTAARMGHRRPAAELTV